MKLNTTISPPNFILELLAREGDKVIAMYAATAFIMQVADIMYSGGKYLNFDTWD